MYTIPTITTEIKYEERLFKVHSSGKVGDWVIQVVAFPDGTALMKRIATKVLGGEPVETLTEYKTGKNIGRSNETTPLMQAVFDAQSRYKKQLDKGYVVEQPEEGAKVTNALGLIKPMLAQPIEKVTNWTFPLIGSPKLDGHRLLAKLDGPENITLYSRGGKEVYLPHIKKDLMQQMIAGYIPEQGTYDGEVYLHGKTLQEISSLVKKWRDGSGELKYYVYDYIPVVGYDSYPVRAEAVHALRESVAVLPLDCVVLQDKDAVNYYHAKNLAAGYEGTMLRWGDFPYEDDKRSKSLMKKKDFQDAEFEIVGAKQGEPYIRGEERYENCVYVCKTKDDVEFECTAPGTMHEKHQAWLTHSQDIGKQLTVKFFNYTPNGAPFLPVALRIREDI